MKIRIAKTGGGEDPKQPIKTYTSQEQINKDNAFVKDFLQRHGASNWDVNNSVVARRVGDKMPTWETNRLVPMRTNVLYDLPSGVTINDVVQTNEGYGFYHPQYGNWIPVDPQAIFQKYGQPKK